MSIQDCKQDMLRIGVDVGSTTVKLLVLDPDDQIIFSVYRRHHSDVRATIVEIIDEALEAVGDGKATITITGSGGLLLANWLGVPFVQEVIANKTAIERIIPATDVAIELGGEDAKIIYFDGGIEQRMNGTCAGGTGAFIDQMAALLNTDASGLDEMAKEHNIIYPIASRCGVFAKTDVQPLLNEGAKREDIAASIFQAVPFAETSPFWAVRCITCRSCASVSSRRSSSPTRRLSSPRSRTCSSLGARHLPPRPTTTS